MTAVSAVCHKADLAHGCVGLKLSCPLPWIIDSVGEDSVGCSNVVKAEFSNCSINQQINSKDGLAIINPVVVVKKLD